MPVRKTKDDVEGAAAKPVRKAAPKKATGAAKPKAAGTSAKSKTATGTARKTSKAAAPRASRGDAPTGFGSGRNLVIVESPAKAKTLQKYLGKDYRIEASVGHVKDLPTSKIGVDVEQGFEPQYVILKGKEKVIERIRKSAMAADKIFLAPDPDREGEAIAWHIASELGHLGPEKTIYRATFNEITKKAVEEALANPRELNQSLYDSQQARRILDRLVGYKISPLLWAKVTRGLSAGRVQSVAVRLVVEREREIKAFNPQEYWSVSADVTVPAPPPFEMRLSQVDGKKPVLASADEARVILEALDALDVAEKSSGIEPTAARANTPSERKEIGARINYPWTVARVEKKDVKRRAAPPFITSTLQQEASRKLGFGAKRTMGAAQRLYEGLELGDLGHTALITYMRTDSTRISGDAISAVRSYITKTYGEDFVPESPNFFKTKKSAQDAHEAVRPTDMSFPPERVVNHLEPDQAKLYTLIWNRFVACQMADAVFEQTKIEADPKAGYIFAATGLVQKFAGYLAVYEEGVDDTPTAGAGPGAEGAAGGVDGAADAAASAAAKNAKLPAVKVGDQLDVAALRANQHFTQPPPRYTEASLVKELEKRGIGRPSTYATIVSVIQDKEYVDKDDSKRFRPTELGGIVTDLLVENFPEVLDIGFTASMEEKLDQVEEGTADWRNVLGDFYKGFKVQLDAATQNMKNVKREEQPTEIPCDKCGEATLVIKWGRNGKFLACPRYPECKNTKDIGALNGETGEVEAAEVIYSDETCDNCGKQMIVKSGRAGRFLACPGYPECKSVKPFKTGVKCTACGTGDLVERMSKRGKMFFSCSNYPKCEHVEWNRPVPQACPECGHAYMLLKETSKRRALVCPGCKHSETAPGGDEAEAGTEDGVEAEPSLV